MSDATPEGIYTNDPKGVPLLVHAYLEGDYALGEILGYFRLGRLDERNDAAMLTLTRKELRDLRNFADAYSFDYDPGFIEMCLDIYRASVELPGDTVVFYEGP